MKNKLNNVYAVILVGGKGKRLRPLSTDAKPKPFLSITRDRKTMFKSAVDRIKKIIPSKNILVVANEAHLRLIKKDFPGINKKNLILEPISRNTAPAIALAAAYLRKMDKEALMVVIPADQYIIDEKKYLNSIKYGINFVRNRDCLLVLALRPTYPATGFGYIKISTSAGKDIYKVERFTEKPGLNAAKRFVRSGRYFWNAGMFIFKAENILNNMKALAPGIYNTLKYIGKVKIDKLYRKFPDISIDYAVMEKADNLYCVKGAYRWQDIGNFEALQEVLQKEKRDFVVKNGKIIRIL